MTDSIIFDGSNAAHRLSSVMTPLTNSKGERVEVMFGLLKLFSAAMRSNPSKRCYIIWDGRGSRAIRQAIDPEYKNNRERAQDLEAKERIKDMHRQVERFWDLFGAHLPVTWMMSNKYEADDVMAMLSHTATRENKTAMIVSGDRDLLQLVNDVVTIYSPNGDKYCKPNNFSKYTAPKDKPSGFPHGMAWLAAKCLMGDSSDNVKGVGGVGEITALKILSEHNWSLVDLKQNPSDELIKSKVGQVILSPSGWQRIALNYKLMSLHGPSHRTLQVDSLETRVGTTNTRELRTNLAKQQFASLMASFTQFILPFQHLETD